MLFRKGIAAGEEGVEVDPEYGHAVRYSNPVKNMNARYKWITLAFVLIFIISDRIPAIPPFYITGEESRALLERSECGRLFQHQVRILSGKENPLFPSLQLNRNILKGKKSERAQISYCLRNIGRKNYLCQMKASRPQEIFACNAKYPPREIGKARDAARTTDDKRGLNDGITGEVKKDGDPGRITVIDRSQMKLQQDTGKGVSGKGCRKAYDHLLGVYTKSKEFQKRKDSEKLLRHWRSQAARNSFEQRCRRVFKSDDLNCILGSRDTVVIQGCLYRVPPAG